MTPSRYFLALLAKSFGFPRRSHRMVEAASEMQLLGEAEVQLGAMVWQNVEGIDALTVEYWNLRKLTKARDQAGEKLATCQHRLALAHEERLSLLSTTPDAHPGLFDDRAALVCELENLTRQRDQIVATARDVRRTYVGLKVKLEVLTKESDGSAATIEEIRKVHDRLAELHQQFTLLKQDRIRVGEEIAAGDQKIDQIDAKFQEQRQERRGQASTAFLVIGESNRDLSVLLAECSVLDTQMRQLYLDIGRYISRHSNQDPSCAAAASQCRSLIEVMRALRRSIALNHRLAEAT